MKNVTVQKYALRILTEAAKHERETIIIIIF